MDSDQTDPTGPATPVVTSPILVVDDEPEVREMLKYQLRRLGYEVDEAVDAFQALERVRSTSYALVFLDVIMPRMDGLTALREIRRASPGLKIVLVTASIDDETFEQAFGREESVDGFINKPLTLASIKRCIEVVLVKGGRYLSAL